MGWQRPPQCHNTILEITSNYTNQGLKIVMDEIEEVKRISLVKGNLKCNESNVNYNAVPTHHILIWRVMKPNDDLSFHDSLEFHPSSEEDKFAAAFSINIPSHPTSDRSHSPHTCSRVIYESENKNLIKNHKLTPV